MNRVEFLPFDVQLVILNFLEPLDILRLRQTCRSLQRTTSERTVWTNALRRVCVRNSIFMPTFPIHDMSLLALENAATEPERFFRKATSSILLKPRSHVITGHHCDSLRDLFIVPGGRYLVTIGSTRVAVWDLGIPGCSQSVTQRMNPIGSQPTPSKSHLGTLVVHPTEDGQGLTISVGYGVNKIFRVVIFRIYPSDNVPLLQQKAEVKAVCCPDMRRYCSLSRNKVIYLLETTLNVWDYVEGAWASIQVPSDYEKLIVSESTMLLLCHDRILIWNMPALSKSKPSSPSNISPTHILEIPNKQIVQEYRTPCGWYSDSPRRLFLDFVHDGEFQRFEVVHKNNDFGITSLGRYPDCNRRVYQPYRFCNDALVSWWVLLRGAAEANITRISSATTSGPMNPGIRLQGSLGDTMFSSPIMFFPCCLCPFSGRFAYFDELDRVKIVDYLSESLAMLGPPPKPVNGGLFAGRDP